MDKKKQRTVYEGKIPTNYPENYAAKLAIIAGVITTLGDVIATIAATLALEEITNAENNQDQQGQRDQEKKMLSMQKQIDSLTVQLKKLKNK
ncbi:hypothetical protein H1230_26695 [Paenibacillus sp. 19GGS1-52]|uniref:hypothetical protein n=1 Tax=Paenibacillus sp. 19GGS1-52 TaxID=2758563 RepID=UPI001EFB8259|nr:hypothetical protein [Paenibacillus sp. 19GGS1-52]ULO06551.1 hypothetical protein H1230_26695 [Paenibacillus sp. 19GGS1-52]